VSGGSGVSATVTSALEAHGRCWGFFPAVVRGEPPPWAEEDSESSDLVGRVEEKGGILEEEAAWERCALVADEDRGGRK
jgi:hypothetical protein